jgi:hypothetical protein
MYRTRIPLVTASFLIASIAGAQSFSDNFNRADSANLGPDWTVIGAGSATRVISNRAGNVAGSNNLSLVNAGLFTASYDQTRVQADVFRTATGTIGYVALAMGHNGATTTGNGLFIKVQANTTASTGFDFIGMYTGVGSGTTTYWTDPPVFFAATAPFSSARMTVWASDPTTINLGIDTDFNGTNEQVYTRHVNLGTITLGNQVGIGVFGTSVAADDFNATVVPEPATITVLGIGALALLCRRKK